MVDTQAERGAGFRQTLETLLRTPYVLGADWFQYHDEPTFGRADGENYNFGLVDSHDQPYEALVQASAALDQTARTGERRWLRPDAPEGVPTAPQDPFANFRPHQALKEWDRDRGFVKPSSRFPQADLYVSWSLEALYLGLYAQDVVETRCYRNQTVPESDRAEWTVRVGNARRTIRARIGAGAPAVTDEPTVCVAHLSGVELNTRCIAAMELPVSLFGRSTFQRGDRVTFSSTFHTHGRAYRTDSGGVFSVWRAHLER